MLFVPLPLFATLIVAVLLGRFVMLRDMRLRTHQLFAVPLGFYALQSLLTSLRWGYILAGRRSAWFCWRRFFRSVPILPTAL